MECLLGCQFIALAKSMQKTLGREALVNSGAEGQGVGRGQAEECGPHLEGGLQGATDGFSGSMTCQISAEGLLFKLSTCDESQRETHSMCSLET